MGNKKLVKIIEIEDMQRTWWYLLFLDKGFVNWKFPNHLVQDTIEMLIGKKKTEEAEDLLNKRKKPVQ